MIYEGQPGEEISGGHKAAPIVHEVFENIFKNAPPDEPLVLLTQNSKDKKKISISGKDEEANETSSADTKDDDQEVPHAQRVAAPVKAAHDDEQRGVGGFFHRLFGH